ncbi:hypothetical protein Tco_0681367 [Tanacetum coccineum]|uniref:Uncharacterized protein n=1 Tax=Tanacetum coccineum TaxID=301880 RepID=A0ABQ4XPE3_9ASTR
MVWLNYTSSEQNISSQTSLPRHWDEKGMFHKENVDYPELIWEYQINYRHSKLRRREIMPYLGFTKIIINHFLSLNPFIPKGSSSGLHTIKDDGVISRLKFVRIGSVSGGGGGGDVGVGIGGGIGVGIGGGVGVGIGGGVGVGIGGGVGVGGVDEEGWDGATAACSCPALGLVATSNIEGNKGLGAPLKPLFIFPKIFLVRLTAR